MEPLDPQDLARRARALRRLARGLVRDEAAADDVAQEACLAALQAPVAARDPQAWLATVARNAARKLGRSEQRRRRREQGAARPEAIPGGRVERAAERAAVQRELTELLLELGEP